MAESTVVSVFERAASHARLLTANLSSSQMLQLYGLYKQATVGPNTTSRPSWINRTDRSKWDAWSSHGDKDSSSAMSEYINLVKTFDPQWSESQPIEVSPRGSWVHHSCFAVGEKQLSEAEKTLFDWVKENNVTRLRNAVDSGVDMANVVDSDGMGLLHWAADRGHLESLRCLLASGTSTNVVDSDGQTPLHYAASCGHIDVVRELLAAGATCSVADSEGQTPLDVAATNDIVHLLKTTDS